MAHSVAQSAAGLPVCAFFLVTAWRPLDGAPNDDIVRSSLEIHSGSGERPPSSASALCVPLDRWPTSSRHGQKNALQNEMYAACHLLSLAYRSLCVICPCIGRSGLTRLCFSRPLSGPSALSSLLGYRNHLAYSSRFFCKAHQPQPTGANLSQILIMNSVTIFKQTLF